MSEKSFDVFISRKSADAHLAAKIYQFLTDKGLVVFDSDYTLSEMGDAEFTRAIDHALENTKHLLVVASAKSHIDRDWVEAEWRFFLNRKRSGKANGNLFTVISGKMRPEDLPPSLRNYEAIPYHPRNFEAIYNYCGQEIDIVNPPPPPFPWKRVTMVSFFIVLLAFAIYSLTRPYDATVFLTPSNELELSPYYPPLDGGILMVTIDNEEKVIQVLNNREATIKNLAFNSRGSEVKLSYEGLHWKLAEETINLAKTIEVNLIPDGSLSRVFGRVTDYNGEQIEGAQIQIDQDTSIFSGENGEFNIVLPYTMQKKRYTLYGTKDGYNSSSEYFYPITGKELPLLLEETE